MNSIDIAIAALQRIKDLDPEEDSKQGFNEWGEADCFNQAQTIAEEALAAINGEPSA